MSAFNEERSALAVAKGQQLAVALATAETVEDIMPVVLGIFPETYLLPVEVDTLTVAAGTLAVFLHDLRGQHPLIAERLEHMVREVGLAAAQVEATDG